MADCCYGNDPNCCNVIPCDSGNFEKISKHVEGKGWVVIADIPRCDENAKRRAESWWKDFPEMHEKYYDAKASGECKCTFTGYVMHLAKEDET